MRLHTWSRGAVVCSLLLLSTQSALADDVVIIRETEQQKAEREFKERQQRIQPNVSAVDQAQRDYEARQRALLCANHPKQC